MKEALKKLMPCLNQIYLRARHLQKKSATRLKNAINLLFHCSQKKTVMNFETKKSFTFRVNFITLTLSAVQVNQDKDILKYCLKPFIRILRKKLPCNSPMYGKQKYKQIIISIFTLIHFHTLITCIYVQCGIIVKIN